MLLQFISYIKFFLPQAPYEFKGLREIETESIKLEIGFARKVIERTEASICSTR